MNRRNFLSFSAKTLLLSSLVKTSFLELKGEPVSKRIIRDKRLLKKKFISDEHYYFNYPHGNGFVPETGELVLGYQGLNADRRFVAWDFNSGKKRHIYTFPPGHHYYDISEITGELFLILNRAQIIAVQTKGNPNPSEVCKLAKKREGETIEGLVSVTKQGDRILYGVNYYPHGEKVASSVTYYEVERSTGQIRELFTADVFGNHQMYSPYDPNWIGFAHEGDITKTYDRIWGWKRGNPKAECLWDEKGETGMLRAGHERWSFHELGIIVIAYPDSVGSPRGLYYVNPLTKSARLISESNCDWHCNIDRTGKWAIVDTLSEWKEPEEGKGWFNDAMVSDIVLVHISSGQRYWLARSHYGANGHPWHPHPHFTPDGKCVVYNDANYENSGKRCTVVAEIQYPF